MDDEKRMQKWNKISFTELISDRTKDGIKLPTNEYNQSGLTAIIDQGQEFIAGYSDETEGAFTDVPAIIFGDHTRVFKYVDFPFFLGADGVKVLKANQEINYKYLYYFFLQAKFPNTGYARHFKWLKELQIPLPPLEEQKHIAAVLDKCTALIAKHKLMLKKYDTLIKSRFIEMFGDNKYPIISISEMVLGKVPSAKKLFNKTDEIKYIDISSVDNKINEIVGYTEYIFEEAPSRAQQHIRKNDILISTVRPNLKNIAINRLDYKEMVASSGFCVLRPKCVPEYLFVAVLQDKFTSDMVAVTTGANYPAIKDSDVLNYEISNPPLELQQQFAAFVQQIDKSKFEIWRYLKFSDIMNKIGFILYD